MSELKPRIVTLDDKDIVVHTKSLKHELQIEQAEAMYEVLNAISENLALGPLEWAAKYGPDSDQHAILVNEVTEARELIEKIDHE